VNSPVEAPSRTVLHTDEEVRMAVHLTPDELSEELESVPIYNGRIDKTLFLNSMSAAGRRLPEGADSLLVPSSG
jgi:hypothetical protein